MAGYSKSNMNPKSNTDGTDNMLAPDARGSHLSPDACACSPMMPPGLDSSGGPNDGYKPGDRQQGNLPD